MMALNALLKLSMLWPVLRNYGDTETIGMRPFAGKNFFVHFDVEYGVIGCTTGTSVLHRDEINARSCRGEQGENFGIHDTP